MVEKTKAAVGPKKAQAGSITRTAAVTKALTTLGKNAMPMQIKGFIKDKFSIEMSNNVVSNYKSEINRKAAKTKPAAGPATKGSAQKMPAMPVPSTLAKKPITAPTAKKEPAPKPQMRPASASGSKGKSSVVGLEDIQAVKALVGKVGADNLKTLIDLISK